MTDEEYEAEFDAMYEHFMEDHVIWPDGKDDRILVWCVFKNHEHIDYPELLDVFNGCLDAALDVAFNLWLEDRDIYVEGRE